MSLRRLAMRALGVRTPAPNFRCGTRVLEVARPSTATVAVGSRSAGLGADAVLLQRDSPYTAWARPSASPMISWSARPSRMATARAFSGRSLGVLGQEVLDHAGQVLRYVVRQRRWGLVDVAHRGGDRRGLVERLGAAEHLVADDAERVQVGGARWPGGRAPARG